MDEDELYLLNTLKEDLNNFLFQKVPSTMTIKEFEELSCKIHNLIEETFEKES